jgi:hypothetical protein
MKRLEDIIKSERGGFDQEEPLPGHEFRFRKKLQEARMVRVVVRISAIAAGLIILAGVGMLLQPFHTIGKAFSPHSLADIRPEYREVEQFYITSLNEKIRELDSISCIPEYKKKALFQELAEITQNDIQLFNELYENPKNEVLIETILNQYKTKLELLDELLMRLEPICKHTNINNHENHESIL